mmetsp:Transcript_13525/g.39467  ORF Transcript_13525/g.39467 Transcript_13525/m.39467 type:complete len:87 (-) Transcript_13525:74-334(-)
MRIPATGSLAISKESSNTVERELIQWHLAVQETPDSTVSSLTLALGAKAVAAEAANNRRRVVEPSSFAATFSKINVENGVVNFQEH